MKTIKVNTIAVNLTVTTDKIGQRAEVYTEKDIENIKDTKDTKEWEYKEKAIEKKHLRWAFKKTMDEILSNIMSFDVKFGEVQTKEGLKDITFTLKHALDSILGYEEFFGITNGKRKTRLEKAEAARKALNNAKAAATINDTILMKKHLDTANKFARQAGLNIQDVCQEINNSIIVGDRLNITLVA